MTDSEENTLAGIELLSDLPAETLLLADQACSWKRFAAQEQMIDQKSETTNVYFVVKGRVRVVIYSLAGREVTLDELDAGSYFGELAALDGQPRSASVLALDETLIAAMPRQRFMELLGGHSEVALRLMLHLAWLVRMSTERIVGLSTLGAHNRICAELLRLAHIHSHGEEELFIKPMPIHGDIASRVGTTRETVARLLSELAREGAVERKGNCFFIRDLERINDGAGMSVFRTLPEE